MSMQASEYRTAVESLSEALRLLERIDPDKLTLDDKWRIRSAANMAFQGSRSAAVLQGLVEATV